ncbi:LEAF RUST 10 DISEASE-RESISTANCE LOCUS RECEPTOR-LIKE PROTEIN KINASE-like 1.2 [Gastrolobium bilobum]|uniref:LEAF RUST 10 DISEASE-RESISTANCE LOCUS RECEPTOR-LIKE PROTEIN KINASE-like 1.2 n=1 Tax=Gastrolobium bilobum TaxID=150636 RepID=UPI002AB0AEC5|nr:LEAF RUST 10 DISEASE-RESISTANCE LOCUS RECEPTOR-LIKE PROTEIN KINASE-like 1.2 [Gastrolobium bilobum]
MAMEEGDLGGGWFLGWVEEVGGGPVVLLGVVLAGVGISLLQVNLSVTVVLGIMILGRLFRRKQGPSALEQRLIDPHSNPEPENGFGIPFFSYKELEKATNNFNRATKLGKNVYYGKLQDGREVAVKRLLSYDCGHNFRQEEQKFKNEIVILNNMSHRNLVSLYGCTPYHDTDGLLLVYEYVPNGSLANHLHGDLARSTTLPWHARMKIAIETASSLAKLHAFDIIHCEVETKNILLTNSFSVKVAHFGFSWLFHDMDHTVVMAPGCFTPVLNLSSKSDVYCFGVVLIELISSRPASEHKYIIDFSNLAIKKISFSKLVDPSLGFDSDKEVKTMIVSVVKLAFQCLQWEKKLRPSMDDVLKELMRN